MLYKIQKYTGFILYLLMLNIIIINAQNHNIDTSEYSNIISSADSLHRSGNYEKAIRNLLRAVDKLENSDEKETLVKVYCKLASIYESKEAFENAIDYYKKVIDYTAPSDYQKVLTYKEKMGDLFAIINNADKALDYYLMVFPAYEKKNNSDALIRISIKLINVYRINKKYNESINLGMKMEELTRKIKDEESNFIFLKSIGYDQFRLKKFQEANISFNETFQKGKEIGAPTYELLNILINRAVCLFNLSKPQNAIELLKEALKLNTPNNYYIQSKIENLTATILLYLNDLYNASIYSNSSIISAQKANNAYMLQECYNTYSKILKAGNDPIRALEYYEKYLAIKDSLSLEERLAQNEKSRNKYDLEKFEKEFRLKLANEDIYEMRIRQIEMEQARQREITRNKIDSLEQERKLTKLELEKQKQEAEKERINRENQTLKYKNDLQEKELKLNKLEEQKRLNDIKRLKREKEQEIKMKRYAIIILILLVFVAVIILLSLISTKNKNVLLASQKKEIEEKNDYLEQLNNEISTQNEIIEKKNIAITDSITYAQKIQSAVLPPEDFFSEKLQDYFILFKPRDIVSGDFYWGTSKNNKLVVTAADCTGHGVPGAFMSMLGTAFLNEIVNEAELLESDKILNQLRINVIKALRQTGEADRPSDGMDIALCVINFDKQILQYSGAFNSMYYISNKELTEVKADRMPIGIHVNHEIPFSKQEIKYKSGDIFYIFSDGFPDQFGGPEYRKFMKSNFKSLLYDNHHKPMAEQKKIINNVFEDWKGNKDQLDDILVIGIRL